MKLIFFISIFSLIKLTVSHFCYWNTGCSYKYLSTETPYNSVRGDIRDSIVKLRGCEPVSIWGIYRHGKRQPGEKFAKKMRDAIAIRNYVKASYEKGHSSLCAQDVENLQNWRIENDFLNGEHDLTEEGREEMIGLGKRLKETFPGLLADLQRGHYTFRSAFGSRIEKSIQYFVKGLGNKNIVIDEVIPHLDVMAPYATCGSYVKNVVQNPQIYNEAEKYLQNSEYLATKDRIQRRSGIEHSLSDENITALYDLCRFTWSAVDNKVSPWCALFTKDDLEVLEYIQDLRHYYRNGYGTKVNEVFGRVPLANLLQSFESAKKGDGKKIVAYATHATMLDQIYTALGLFQDSAVLTGANRNPDRKWRTSKISVFSANLVAVLNRCTNHSEDYNVVFYLNEEPMRSICEEGVCSWIEFENKLRPFINTTIDFYEKCYESLGCIKITQEWTHPQYRPYNLLPSDRHAVNTIFVLWTIQGYVISPEVIGTNTLNGTNINSHIKILVHDFTSNGYTGWIQHLAITVLSNPNCGQSIISVDWAAGAEPPYIQAIANARLVALEIVHFLSKLKTTSDLRMENVHIIGHGIGAHIAGYVGKISPPKRITALDPSGTFFENMPSSVHLSREDAEYIEVLHTDGSTSGQGSRPLFGHVDFFANGGSKQPGCKDTHIFLSSVKRGDLKLGQILKGCSHKRSLKYYIETFINNSCAFLGVACESYKAFLNGRCTSCGDDMESCLRLNTLKPPRSLSSLPGYYFVTSSSPPFCGEMIKISMDITSISPDITYVNGYFNITIKQSIGDVNFLINENSIIAALRTNKKHTFVVFRATPPSLLVPIKSIFIKWQHKPLPYTWCSPPRILEFMIYKLSDNAADKPQWFCKMNTSFAHVNYGRELQPCKENTKN